MTSKFRTLGDLILIIKWIFMNKLSSKLALFVITLTLTSIQCCFVAAAASASQFSISDEKFNYSFKAPSTEYVKIKHEKIAKDAAFLIRRSKPNVFFMMIAEVGGVDLLTLEELDDIVISGIKSAGDEVEVTKKEPFSLNEMEGLRLDVNAKVSNKLISYSFWLYEHNGFVYQLLAWSKRRLASQMHLEFSKLIRGFKLNSMSRIAFLDGNKPLPKFNSRYGYSLITKNTPWQIWSDLKEYYPYAEVGGEIGVHGLFNIIPFCYGQDKPHDVAIKSTLFREFDLTYPEPEMVVGKDLKIGVFSAEAISYEMDIDGDLHQARFTTVISENCALLISIWTTIEGDKVEKLNELLLSKLEINKFKSKADKAQPRSAHFFNGVGLYYYKAKNYPLALNNFKLALRKNPTKSIYANNLFDTFNKLERQQDAIHYFQKEMKSIVLNAESYSWLAWFYQKQKDVKQSQKFYEKAFQQGYQNDGELETYIDLLIADGKLKQAEKAANEYVKDVNGFLIARKKALIKRKQKMFHKALEILDEVQKGKPLNVDIVFEKIYLYDDLKEYEKIVKLSDSLIDNGYASAGAYYQKGQAEYNLTWYLQSKKSFEDALKIAPNNNNVKEFLSHVSGMLGEGDSTTISTPIPEVEIPTHQKLIASDSLEYKNYDSYYIKKTIAFYFKAGEKIRTTKRRVVKIVSQQGIKRFSTLEVDFNPFYERAFINKVEVRDAQGKVLSTGKRSSYYVNDSKGTIADTKKTIHIPVTNLAVGNVIDFVYSLETLSDMDKFPYTYEFHSSSRPVQESLIYVTGDVDVLDYTQYKSSKPIKKKQTLLWRELKPTPHINEPQQVRASTYLPAVMITHSNQNWSSLAKNYQENISEKLQISPELIKITKNLTSTKATLKQKTESIIDYIQTNIIYKAIEFGVRGRVPNTPHETILNRYGDCKDHAVLLWAMLNVADIESSLVLVNLSENVNANYPSLDQFDHMIVKVETSNGPEYIDVTEKDMSLFGKAPGGLGGANGLVLNGSNSEITTISDYLPVDNSIDSSRLIQLDKDGVAIVNETLTLNGYSESSFRSYLKSFEAGELFDWAQNFLSRQVQGINLISFDVKNLLDSKSPLILEMNYQVENILLEDNKILYKDVSLWEHYYLLPEKVNSRKSDFQIRYPTTFSGSTTLALPEGYTANLKKVAPIAGHNKFAHYTVDWDAQINTIKSSYQITEKSGSHSKKIYNIYFKRMNEFINELSKPIMLGPK